MNNNEDLKPCPFCGGEAEVRIFFGNVWVHCNVCDKGFSHFSSEREAISTWNKLICVKQNAEQLDTNSVASSGVNAKPPMPTWKKW